MPLSTPVPSANHILVDALERLLGIQPLPEAVSAWSARLADGMSAADFLAAIAALPHYTAGRRVSSTFLPGHYHSPVVDPATVREYVAMSRAVEPSDIAGIDIPLAAMEAFWRRHADLLAATPFPEKPDPRWRYHELGGPFPISDATILRAMIHVHRPRRIIEIGSGYSTACMLDAADEASLAELRITCIEPFPQRLRSIMRPGDEQRVDIHERRVQGMPLDAYRSLEQGDILFIDSTHVLKTGSDVHYELFYILPVLKPGVLVHFHDCQFPFEYPDKWVFDNNYSWNEIYALRAFLMWNDRFKVHFWSSIFARRYRALIGQTFPRFFPNPGGSIWLRVCAET